MGQIGQTIGQLSSLSSRTIYRLPAICCHFVLQDKDKDVQQLTCLTLGRPNGPAYSTSELLNTPQINSVTGQDHVDDMHCAVFINDPR